MSEHVEQIRAKVEAKAEEAAARRQEDKLNHKEDKAEVMRLVE